MALVTGAARGIGAAIVRRFTEAGAKVAITHLGTERNEHLSAALIGELASDRVMAVIADAASGPDMEAATNRVSAAFGTVDVLILNAAQVGHLPWDEITVDDWDRMMDVNLRGAFVASLAAIEGMRKTAMARSSRSAP